MHATCRVVETKGEEGVVCKEKASWVIIRGVIRCD